MQKVLHAIFKITMITVITLILIEILLQIIFLSLPQAIIQRMPQYQERYGIQFQTSHGAREYPANEQVHIEINQFSGDLYQISCLSPRDATPIEPYEVQYRRDSHGFRNPEPWADKIDLAIIGDSFTAAESVIRPYWYDLSKSQLVLGLPGSGTLEQILLYQQFIVTRSPEIVILAYFGGNDITDNVTFYDLQKAGMTFADKTHQNRNPFEYLVSFHLLLYIRDALTQSNQPQCHYPLIAQTRPPTPITFFDRMVSTLTLDTNTLQQTEGFKITQEAIRDFASQVKSSGGEFILMYIPQKAEVYWDKLDIDTQNMILENLPVSPLLETRSATIHLEAQRSLLQSLADNNNFDMLDLTPELIDAVDDGLSPYFFADTHWNQNGHDLVHRVIVDFLSKETLD